MGDPAPPPRNAFDAVPPVVLVVAAIASIQFGASFAKSLFDDVGPAGTVTLRVLFAAIVLVALWRPRIRGYAGNQWRLILAYGVCLGLMNLTFYEALDRIPLGVAVTLEFVGPLGVAILGSRRALDVVWVVLAGAGILLLADPAGGSLDETGMALALIAGVFWGLYIYVADVAGRAISGSASIALAMCVAALVVLPFGIEQAGADLISAEVLVIGFGVALLSSAIPYTLELESLRRLPKRVFGVLMSLEPAMAALAGLVVLGEVLHARELTGIALVVAASAGAARGSGALTPRD